jgi:hypothetical protein
MRHIVILVHKNGPFENSGYFLNQMSEIWRKDGIQISVLRDLKSRLDADLAILHVDLTVIPEEYLDFVRSYPKTINARIKDISKRIISRQLVRRGDGYQGPVIVKTNRNYGGTNEALLAQNGSMLQRGVLSFRNRLPWSFRSYLAVSNYPVFESVRQIPWAVWLNPDLIVDRFLPERQNGHYCLRTWVFMGDKETNSISYSQHPVIKSSNVIRREQVSEVPEELRQMRRELGFDFGKFDYAMVDGRAVLYDANRTPTLGYFQKDNFSPSVRILAEGIRSYFEKAML